MRMGMGIVRGIRLIGLIRVGICERVYLDFLKKHVVINSLYLAGHPA